MSENQEKQQDTAALTPEVVQSPQTNYRTIDPKTALAYGNQFWQSGYFGDLTSSAQAFVKVQAGAELGLEPFASVNGIHIIPKNKYKPEEGCAIQLAAVTMAGLIRRSKKYDYRIKKHTNEICEIEFILEGEILGTETFTIDDARTAKLLERWDNKENKYVEKKDSPWFKSPKNMLFARCMSNGAKFHCPDIFQGPIYTEGDDFSSDFTPEANPRSQQNTQQVVNETPEVKTPKEPTKASTLTPEAEAKAIAEIKAEIVEIYNSGFFEDTKDKFDIEKARDLKKWSANISKLRQQKSERQERLNAVLEALDAKQTQQAIDEEMPVWNEEAWLSLCPEFTKALSEKQFELADIPL